MRTALGFILSLLLACASTIAADGWALTSPKHASRRVVVTLFLGSQQIEQWILPVARGRQPVRDYIQHKWVRLPRERDKSLPRRLFTDTWLGSIDADEAWVRIAWWPNKRRDGAERLTNCYIATTFRSTQTLELEHELRVVVRYEDKG
jgi:hypothetical protein